MMDSTSESDDETPRPRLRMYEKKKKNTFFKSVTCPCRWAKKGLCATCSCLLGPLIGVIILTVLVVVLIAWAPWSSTTSIASIESAVLETVEASVNKFLTESLGQASRLFSLSATGNSNNVQCLIETYLTRTSAYVQYPTYVLTGALEVNSSFIGYSLHIDSTQQIIPTLGVFLALRRADANYPTLLALNHTLHEKSYNGTVRCNPVDPASVCSRLEDATTLEDPRSTNFLVLMTSDGQRLAEAHIYCSFIVMR